MEHLKKKSISICFKINCAMQWQKVMFLTGSVCLLLLPSQLLRNYPRYVKPNAFTWITNFIRVMHGTGLRHHGTRSLQQRCYTGRSESVKKVVYPSIWAPCPDEGLIPVEQFAVVGWLKNTVMAAAGVENALSKSLHTEEWAVGAGANILFP